MVSLPTKELETDKEAEKRKRLQAKDDNCPMNAALKAILEVGDRLLHAWPSAMMGAADSDGKQRRKLSSSHSAIVPSGCSTMMAGKPKLSIAHGEGRRLHSSLSS